MQESLKPYEEIPSELLLCNGARRGKWTLEEEQLTERIIEDFSLGIPLFPPLFLYLNRDFVYLRHRDIRFERRYYVEKLFVVVVEL